MSRRSKARRGAGPSRSGAAPEIAAPRPDERILAAPAAWIAVAVAAACVLLSVTTRIDDPDVWQHLLVGKAIARLGHGSADPPLDVAALRASRRAAVVGLPRAAVAVLVDRRRHRAVRVAMAHDAPHLRHPRFGRRGAPGPHGLSPLLVLVVCALTYRLRSQARPETLVAVLLALQLLLIVPRRRALGVRTGVALVAIALGLGERPPLVLPRARADRHRRDRRRGRGARNREPRARDPSVGDHAARGGDRDLVREPVRLARAGAAVRVLPVLAS